MNPQPMYTQQELDAKLLSAANALRGPIDPADFKAYIFPLLFLKRISDTWKWEYEQLLQRYDGDEGLAREPDQYRFVVPQAPDGKRHPDTPKGCMWEDVLALESNVGAGLQLIFDRLQEANPETLTGVFGTTQWANKQVLPEERLTAVIDVFTGLKLDPDSVTHDLLGNAYEYLLKNFADESGKKAGEFFTPRAVVRLLVRLLGPQEGESVYDPTCGSGGMLVESVNTVRANGQDPRTLRLYGQEVSATTAAIARMNLYMHDIETFSIRTGDTLRKPRFLDSDTALSKFQVVIANPPFSVGGDTPWGYEAWADDPWNRSALGVPPRSYADFAFVEHMLASMSAEHGRLAVVISQGVLSRGRSERLIRKNLIEAGLLEAVVRLPPNIFYGTPLTACVLVCSADLPPDRRGRVMFVDGSGSFKKGSPKNAMTDGHVNDVFEAFRSGESSGAEGVAVRSVPAQEIEANDWSLKFGLYLSEVTDEEADVQAALAEVDETWASLLDANAALQERLNEAGLRA